MTCPQILFDIPEDLDFSINKDERAGSALAIPGDCTIRERKAHVENFYRGKSLQRCNQRSLANTAVWNFIIQEPFDDVKVTDKLRILRQICEYFEVLLQAERGEGLSRIYRFYFGHTSVRS